MTQVIPNCMPVYHAFDETIRRKRRDYIGVYGYAYVSWNWVTPLAEWIGKRRVLEVMSGTGALAFALQQKNVAIKATDDYSWYTRRKWQKPWVPVEKVDGVEAILRYGENADILIMSWPPLGSEVAHDVLKTYHEINPAGLLLYIGEWGMSAADEKFFCHFNEISDPSFISVQEQFESWPGIRDTPLLGRYKQK